MVLHKLLTRRKLRTGQVSDAIRKLQRTPKLPAELLKFSAGAQDSAAIQYAADYIKRGQVIGVPTDTFYGLAADPLNLSAVEGSIG